MATKQEKLLGLFIGTVAGRVISGNYIKQNAIPEEDQWKYKLGYSLGGALVGYLAALWLGAPDDTVNYRLLHGNKTVYHGITYADRVSMRRLEHQANGKTFKRMVCDDAKPRCEALVLEKALISQDKPLYNIVHNC